MTQQLITTCYFALDLLGISHLDLLVQELTEVCEKWQDIGKELGVSTFTLSHIKSSNPGDCLKEVFGERLRHHTTSWGDIIAVLRSSRVGEFQLADHLEAKYYPSELTQRKFMEYNLWEVESRLIILRV